MLTVLYLFPLALFGCSEQIGCGVAYFFLCFFGVYYFNKQYVRAFARARALLLLYLCMFGRGVIS